MAPCSHRLRYRQWPWWEEFRRTTLTCCRCTSRSFVWKKHVLSGGLTWALGHGVHIGRPKRQWEKQWKKTSSKSQQQRKIQTTSTKMSMAMEVGMREKIPGEGVGGEVAAAHAPHKKAPKGKASGSKPEQKREQKEPSQEASIEVPKVDLASPPPPQTAAAKPVERDTSRENIDKFFAEHPGALPADHALAKSRPKAEHTSTPPDTASTTTAERAEAKQFKKDVEKEEREAKTPTKTPPRRSRRSRKSHTPKRKCETGTPKKTPKRANKRKKAKSEGSPAKDATRKEAGYPEEERNAKKEKIWQGQLQGSPGCLGVSVYMALSPKNTMKIWRACLRCASFFPIDRKKMSLSWRALLHKWSIWFYRRIWRTRSLFLRSNRFSFRLFHLKKMHSRSFTLRAPRGVPGEASGEKLSSIGVLLGS